MGSGLNENYQGAPSDGSAWLSGDCNLRVFRGGAWNFEPKGLRAMRSTPIVKKKWQSQKRCGNETATYLRYGSG
jgi:formylglycine-generating enzyme required for sulfatase activity